MMLCECRWLMVVHQLSLTIHSPINTSSKTDFHTTLLNKMAFNSIMVLAIAPKITALVSCLGATAVISAVLRSKKNRGNMQQRLVCAISAIDLLANLMWVFANFMIPASYDVFPWTHGNEATCSAQGFILQFCLSTIIYHSCLSFYYVLIIKYKWNEKRIRKVEKWFHIVPLTLGLGTAIFGLALDVYDAAVWNCFISGEHKVVRLSIFYGPVWFCIVFSLFNLYQIYGHVKEQEAKSAKYTSAHRRSSTKLKHTKAVSTQCNLYVMSFVLSWTLPSVSRILPLFNAKVPLWVNICAAIFLPCQGTFNAIVYFRIRYKRLRAANSSRSAAWAIMQIVVSMICPCCDHVEQDDGVDAEPSLRTTMFSNTGTLRSTFKSIKENMRNVFGITKRRQSDVKQPTDRIMSSARFGSQSLSSNRAHFPSTDSKLRKTISVVQEFESQKLVSGKDDVDEEVGHPLGAIEQNLFNEQIPMKIPPCRDKRSSLDNKSGMKLADAGSDADVDAGADAGFDAEAYADRITDPANNEHTNDEVTDAINTGDTDEGIDDFNEEYKMDVLDTSRLDATLMESFKA